MGNPIVWVCMECGREQPDQELQCVCGNIDALMFIEKGLHSAVDAPVKTMVDETPAEVAPMADDTPAETPAPEPDPEPEPKKSAKGRWRTNR